MRKLTCLALVLLLVGLLPARAADSSYVPDSQETTVPVEIGNVRSEERRVGWK